MNIEVELDTEYLDEAPWRSFSLQTDGDTLEELIANASISETDQDGGEIRTYSLESAPNDVESEAMLVITRRFVREKLGAK